ncbi:hypothetical protein CYMTET_17859 [Cymbomonas tetramitiformis]|uniref:Uncharacterized protein n=1 Tax=Cymbomonas tetramitiformis TaxID=36881 RepID=A0AAE0G979_9CHLO|nr:hypothetical protein CYMTET_17859 [Cymbomonas tetramitiformis]
MCPTPPKSCRTLRRRLPIRSEKSIEEAHTQHCRNASVKAGSPEDGHHGSFLQSESHRRDFVTGSVASTAAALCSPAEALVTMPHPEGEDEIIMAYELAVPLRVTALKGSMPSGWAADFRTTQGKNARVDVKQEPQLMNIYENLELWAGAGAPRKGSKRRGRKTAEQVSDAVTLGDSWLSPAIQNGLLQPIPNARHSSWWGDLSPRWQELVTRDSSGRLDPSGEVWAVPYRWGCTMFAYRQDKLKQRRIAPPTDWADLWRPEFRGRIAMVNAPREVLGAVFKRSGMSYNPDHLGAQSVGASQESCLHGHPTVPALSTAPFAAGQVEDSLQELMAQVKVFSNMISFKALDAGEVWVVVAWSGEVLAAAKRSPKLGVSVPTSGTSLWADLWAIPSGRSSTQDGMGPSPLLDQWLEYTLQPTRLPSDNGLQGGAAPLLLPEATSVVNKSRRHVATEREEQRSALDTAGRHMQHNPRKLVEGEMPAKEILERSEFLLPVPAQVATQYRLLLQ